MKYLEEYLIAAHKHSSNHKKRLSKATDAVVFIVVKHILQLKLPNG
jgi:hypothetical protein